MTITDTTEVPSIHALMPRVMASVGAIGKTQENKEQNFLFRGIDDALNAVHGALVEHGVHYAPEVLSSAYDEYETKRGTRMRSCTVRVRYRFYGPAGDHFDMVTDGESADSGDKSTGKAQSIALKFALLHGLCIPTKDMQVDDPDAHAHERASAHDAPPDESPCPTCEAVIPGARSSKEPMRAHMIEVHGWTRNEDGTAAPPPKAAEPATEQAPDAAESPATSTESPPQHPAGAETPPNAPTTTEQPAAAPQPADDDGLGSAIAVHEEALDTTQKRAYRAWLRGQQVPFGPDGGADLAGLSETVLGRIEQYLTQLRQPKAS